MAVLSITYGPYTQSGGQQTIALTSTQRSRYNHSIAVKFVDSTGNTVTPSAGTMKAWARREGGGLFEPLDVQTIDVTVSGGWPYTETPCDSLMVQPFNVPSDLSFYVIVNSLSLQS